MTNATKTTPAEGLESSASPRRESGVGTQTAGAGSIPDAGNSKTTPEEMIVEVNVTGTYRIRQKEVGAKIVWVFERIR